VLSLRQIFPNVTRILRGADAAQKWLRNADHYCQCPLTQFSMFPQRGDLPSKRITGGQIAAPENQSQRQERFIP